MNDPASIPDPAAPLEAVDPYYRTVLARLVEDIRSVEDEAGPLRSRLAEIDRKLADMRRSARAISAMLGDVVPEVEPSASIRRRGDERARHADAIARVMREAGGPMTVSEVVELLLRSGHELPVTRKARYNTVCMSMTRWPHVFENVSRGVWRLRERTTS